MNNNTRILYDGTDMFIDKNTNFLVIKLQAFAGNPLCSAVCMNCFEKCTYVFVNFKDDSRNAPKRLRKNCAINKL